VWCNHAVLKKIKIGISTHFQLPQIQRKINIKTCSKLLTRKITCQVLSQKQFKQNNRYWGDFWIFCRDRLPDNIIRTIRLYFFLTFFSKQFSISSSQHVSIQLTVHFLRAFSIRSPNLSFPSKQRIFSRQATILSCKAHKLNSRRGEISNRRRRPWWYIALRARQGLA